MRAEERKALDPMLVLILFLLSVFLASLGIFNPLEIGLVGLVVVFLLFIEPLLEKAKIIETGEQKFLYTIMVVFLGLLMYGGIEKGYIPVLKLTGILVLDTIVSVGLYTILLLVLLVVLLVYYYKDRIQRYFK